MDPTGRDPPVVAGDATLRHAEYIGSWLKVLRSDKRAVFVAATRAQQAADYLIRLRHPPELEPAVLAA